MSIEQLAYLYILDHRCGKAGLTALVSRFFGSDWEENWYFIPYKEGRKKLYQLLHYLRKAGINTNI